MGRMLEGVDDGQICLSVPDGLGTVVVRIRSEFLGGLNGPCFSVIFDIN